MLGEISKAIQCFLAPLGTGALTSSTSVGQSEMRARQKPTLGEGRSLSLGSPNKEKTWRRREGGKTCWETIGLKEQDSEFDPRHVLSPSVGRKGCSVAQFCPTDTFAILWTVVCQVLPSMGFSRQEYWRGLPFPTLGDLPDPGIEPESLWSPALASELFTTEPPGKP